MTKEQPTANVKKSNTPPCWRERNWVLGSIISAPGPVHVKVKKVRSFKDLNFTFDVDVPLNTDEDKKVKVMQGDFTAVLADKATKHLESKEDNLFIPPGYFLEFRKLLDDNKVLVCVWHPRATLEEVKKGVRRKTFNKSAGKGNVPSSSDSTRSSSPAVGSQDTE